MARAIGLDFGTTNSSISVVGDDGRPRLARFEIDGALQPTFRSLVYLEPNERDAELPPSVLAGPRAVEAHLESDGEGRLIQSTKSFLATRYASTRVFGFEFQLEDLVSFILLELRSAAERQFGELSGPVVVGRPVRFVSAANAHDDDIALGRLESALRRAGFDEVLFEYEPVAAAYHYASRTPRQEIVLIADFGGGTSDFSLLRLGGPGRAPEILGTSGLGVAGDAFDARIVRHLVAPHLGRGGEVRGEFGTRIPVPRWIYSSLERWHHLSFLKSPRTMSMLLDLKQRAGERSAPIDALIHVVQNDLGYGLYRAVEGAKCALSKERSTELVFVDPPVEIGDGFARDDFEEWIEEEIAAIERTVDDLLRAASLGTHAVDRVFMTGGSSFVPRVRRVFEDRFSQERILRGGELTSVATGLGLRGLAA